MEYEDRLRIATPEGVDVELTLAGAGSRSMGAAIDLTIQLVIWLASSAVVGVVADGGGWLLALLPILAFLIVFGYDVAFEVLGGGRTPGKRVVGLRVVRLGGRPITLIPSVIRNVVRLIDFSPGLYAFGLLAILMTPRNQRLGDLAAGTLVVRERTAESKRADSVAEAAVPPLPPDHPAMQWDLSAIGAEEIAVVRRFLERRWELDGHAHAHLAHDLASRLRPRVAGVPAELPSETFLELLVRVKAMRA